MMTVKQLKQLQLVPELLLLEQPAQLLLAKTAETYHALHVGATTAAVEAPLAPRLAYSPVPQLIVAVRQRRPGMYPAGW